MKHKKGNGIKAPGKSRWVMKFGNGDLMTTTGYYHKHEVEEWECSQPVRAITE